jgi:hypothetical protein
MEKSQVTTIGKALFSLGNIFGESNFFYFHRKNTYIIILLFKLCHISFCGHFEVNEQVYVNIRIWLLLEMRKKQCVTSDVHALHLKRFCHFSSQI